MKLTDIISISGKPGLYKLINRTRMPFTAEDLESGRKMPLFARDNIVSLADISIYTEEGEKPLGEVFEEIKSKHPECIKNESEVLSNSTSLHSFMQEVLPIYDKEKVHDSDIKKLIKWYNLLRKSGMEVFVPKEETNTSEVENN